MKNPKISVVMAVYNGEKYIRPSIESILSQTYKDFEFVIINDCSNDRTLDIIKSYNDQRIKIINNERNLGQTASLNIGVRHSRGEYIGRTDPGDISYPQRFEKQLKFFAKNPQFAAVGTSAYLLNEEGRIRGVRPVSTEPDNIFLRIFFDNPLIHISTLINKGKLLKLGCYDEFFARAQDYDLWSRFIMSGFKVGNLKDVLAAYIVHTYSQKRNSRDITEFCDVLYRNISIFTTLKIERETVSRLQKIFDIPVSGELDYKECLDLLDIFLQFFLNLKPEYRIPIDWRFINSVLGKFQYNIGMSVLRKGNSFEARQMFIKSIGNRYFSLLPYIGFVLTYLNPSLQKSILGMRMKYVSCINKNKFEYNY